MSAQPVVIQARVELPAHRDAAPDREATVETPSRPLPPACEYADIGLGNGFLLDRAGERPALNVIGEIG